MAAIMLEDMRGIRAMMNYLEWSIECRTNSTSLFISDRPIRDITQNPINEKTKENTDILDFFQVGNQEDFAIRFVDRPGTGNWSRELSRYTMVLPDKFAFYAMQYMKEKFPNIRELTLVVTTEWTAKCLTELLRNWNARLTKLVLLDLTGNNWSNWPELHELLSEIPNLVELSVNLNPFTPETLHMAFFEAEHLKKLYIRIPNMFELYEFFDRVNKANPNLLSAQLDTLGIFDLEMDEYSLNIGMNATTGLCQRLHRLYCRYTFTEDVNPTIEGHFVNMHWLKYLNITLKCAKYKNLTIPNIMVRLKVLERLEELRISIESEYYKLPGLYNQTNVSQTQQIQQNSLRHFELCSSIDPHVAFDEVVKPFFNNYKEPTDADAPPPLNKEVKYFVSIKSDYVTRYVLHPPAAVNIPVESENNNKNDAEKNGPQQQQQKQVMFCEKCVDTVKSLIAQYGVEPLNRLEILTWELDCASIDTKKAKLDWTPRKMNLKLLEQKVIPVVIVEN